MTKNVIMKPADRRLLEHYENRRGYIISKEERHGLGDWQRKNRMKLRNILKDHYLQTKHCLRVDGLKMTEEEVPNIPTVSKMIRRHYGPSIS